MVDEQILWTALLGLYMLALLLLTRWPYQWMVNRGVSPIRAIYYNRKIVHMAGSGVTSLLVPLVFEDLWFPMFGGIVLGLLLHIAHVSGRRMYWFQAEDNQNDVSFAIMWWVSLSVLWWLLGDPWLAIIPALLMSFGDGVTGVVRNIYVRRRSKHPIGNLFMLLVSVPIGWFAAGAAEVPLPGWGALAAVAATLVERYEIGPVDDNILIALVSTAILLLGASIGPLGG